MHLLQFFFFLLYICVCIHVCVHVCVCVSVYVSMCVYMCVCVCVSVRMCVCHCAQCGPTPLATFLLLQDMFFFYSPIPPPHTYRVVFALSIIIRSSCILVVIFHLPPSPLKNFLESLVIRVCILLSQNFIHHPPCMQKKVAHCQKPAARYAVDVNTSSSDTTAGSQVQGGSVYNIKDSIIFRKP